MPITSVLSGATFISINVIYSDLLKLISNSICEIHSDWHRAIEYFDCWNLNYKYYGTVKRCLKNIYDFSEELSFLLVRNSKAEYWPAGLKTRELRERNRDIIKQLKFRKCS